MIKIINEPYQLLFDVVEKLYGKIDAEIQFAPMEEGEGAGCTTFTDDNGTPLITVNASIPFIATIEIIAHEIAHVIAGIKNAHNEKWQKVFSDIHEHYNRAIEDDANENGLSVEQVELTTVQKC